MFLYKEDLCRFNFNVGPEDKYMCEFIEESFMGRRAGAVDGMLPYPRVAQKIYM
jgi:hypothetical protein